MARALPLSELRPTTRFETLIAWEPETEEKEKRWLHELLYKINMRAVDGTSSKHLAKLQDQSNNFEDLGFRAQVASDGLHITDLGPELGGSTENACLFIAAFLEHCRPQRAVRLPYSEVVKGRTMHGKYGVGPDGIKEMYGIRQRHLR